MMQENETPAKPPPPKRQPKMPTPLAAEPKISVRLIAKQLGLSPATVSLALNGRRPTGFVSAATRQQVWHAAKEMGYPLDRLRTRRSALERVAAFAQNAPNPVFSETMQHLCRALNQHHVEVLTHLTRSQREAYALAQQLFQRGQIDAAVFVGSRLEMPTLDMPCVFLGEVPEEAHVWQVRADNEGGGRAVGEYLWSLGHRCIAALMPGLPNLVSERRMVGLHASWAERGGAPSDIQPLTIDVGLSSEGELRATLAKFLERNRGGAEPVTALFCFNDWVAGTTIKVLRGLGVRVPEDLSVVGFDDSLYATLLDPPLTTVHNPFDELGRLGSELLLEQVETPDALPRVLVARCNLIGRQSCAPVLAHSGKESRPTSYAQ